jgi:hypothetical protein
MREEHRLRMFENWVLKEILGPKRSNRGWKRLHKEARSKCGGDVHMGLWCGNLTERDHLENLGVDGRIVLNLSSRIWMGHGLV